MSEEDTPEMLGYVDVDADGFVTPTDALMILNYLNDRTDEESFQADWSDAVDDFFAEFGLS